MDVNVRFNIAMVIAVVLGEFVSALWYSNAHPWVRKLGDRYWITALICDAGLVVILQYILDHYWGVTKWEDAIILSLWLTLAFVTLEAPHVVYGARSVSYFAVHAAHKFTLMFVMMLALLYFKNYHY